MIHAKELAEYLDVSKRETARKKIEKYIDQEIKRNALAGNNDFIISTKMSKTNEPGMTESTFHYLWEMDDLSEDSAALVRHDVLDHYRKHGYFVHATHQSNLPYESYLVLKFENLHLTAKKHKQHKRG